MDIRELHELEHYIVPKYMLDDMMHVYKNVIQMSSAHTELAMMLVLFIGKLTDLNRSDTDHLNTFLQ